MVPVQRLGGTLPAIQVTGALSNSVQPHPSSEDLCFGSRRADLSKALRGIGSILDTTGATDAVDRTQTSRPALELGERGEAEQHVSYMTGGMVFAKADHL